MLNQEDSQVANVQQVEKKNEVIFRVVAADFVVSAANLRQCPTPELPEIAIAGRSNVGKSSLINLLCNRRNLAKTSSTPGKTRLINFFQLRIEPGDIHLHLVDLPGYGFTKSGKAFQEEWGRTLQEFLEKRPLRGILHLIDSRHEPTALDCQMREWIVYREIPSITALTKSDKLKQNDISKSRKTIHTILQLTADEPCILTSVTKKTGIQELLQALITLIS